MRQDTEWRSEFLKLCGPGMLAGITFDMWLKLLRQRGKTMEISRCLRAITITTQSLKNSFWSKLERRRFDKQIEKVSIHPPIFILGHWRSGTTHLHEMLARDDRFGYPNSYQVSFPHTFLTTEKFGTKFLSFFMPKRRPMDNMHLTLSSPQEDEFALCASTLKSPCVSWVFPRQKGEFEKYLTLESVSADELKEWRDALVWFLKKVQLRSNRPLLLKSPPHTARIRLLLEYFPDARFVHIHRNPYRVIQSSLRTFKIISEWHGLQRLSLDDLEEWTVQQYAVMYRAFFSQRAAIPKGHFHEICYEELEKDPVSEIQRMYEALNLPDFGQAEPSLRNYLQSISGYQKNQLPEPPAELRARINRECRESFDQWGYPVQAE